MRFDQKVFAVIFDSESREKPEAYMIIPAADADDEPTKIAL
jgi:3,4-dihydroxy-2-butanone 4-phosphate synthase